MSEHETTRHIIVAASIAHPGREDEMIRWLDERHLPDNLSVDGVVAAQRFDVTGPPKMEGLPAWPTLVLYEIETHDIDKVMAELHARVRTPAMPISEAFDPVRSIRFRAIAAGPRLTAEG